jgi:hypothetical protein
VGYQGVNRPPGECGEMAVAPWKAIRRTTLGEGQQVFFISRLLTRLPLAPLSVAARRFAPMTSETNAAVVEFRPASVESVSGTCGRRLATPAGVVSQDLSNVPKSCTPEQSARPFWGRTARDVPTDAARSPPLSQRLTARCPRPSGSPTVKQSSGLLPISSFFLVPVQATLLRKCIGRDVGLRTQF